MDSSTTLAGLPNEMMQEIVQHISPTNTSITSISLISPSWFLYLRNSDPLFTRIHLHSGNVLQFLALLQSPLCSFRQSVRQLYLDWTLARILQDAQETIHSILLNPYTPHFLGTRADRPKSTRVKFEQNMEKFLMPRAKKCQFLNIVCLFPCLEHLQVHLMEIESNIPGFRTQPPVSLRLKSLSVVCNSSPPETIEKGTYISPEWRRFLKWVRLNRIFTIRNLYLTRMAPWNYRAAEMLIDLQRTSSNICISDPRVVSEHHIACSPM